MTFGDGPLGLVLTDTRLIREVHESGQARALGVQAGDSLVKVGDADVSATDYQDILTLIKSSTRPVTLLFIRKPAHSAARNAVTAAGGFLKKALVTGVSLIAAVDRAIGAAVDDGARVRRLGCVDMTDFAHICAPRNLCSKWRLRHGKPPSVPGGCSLVGSTFAPPSSAEVRRIGAAVQGRAAKNSQTSLLPAEVTAAMAEDPAYIAVRALSAAQDARLAVLRERGDAILGR